MKGHQLEMISGCIIMVAVVLGVIISLMCLAMPVRAFSATATPTGIKGTQRTTSEMLTEAAKATPFTAISTKPSPGKPPTKQPGPNTSTGSEGQQGSGGAVPIPPILMFTILMILVIMVVVVLLVGGHL